MQIGTNEELREKLHTSESEVNIETDADTIAQAEVINNSPLLT